MRWAWLGADEESEWVRRVLTAATPLELVHVAESDWESLLVREDCAAVVVARGRDPVLRAEQLKKLVAGGVPVLALHPAVDVLTGYEIEVIRREAGGQIVAFAPNWQHPAWERLETIFRQGESSPIGRPEQILFERAVRQRDRTTALDAFSQDVHLLRRLLGTIGSIHAVGDVRSDGTWSSLVVHAGGEDGVAANWSLLPPAAEETSRVRLVGNRGTVTLRISSDPHAVPWVLENRGGLETFAAVPQDADRLRQWLRGEPGRAGEWPDWNETCLDLEISEAAEKSLRRKRAIELYTTNRSEEKTFKGFMAASGCLILVAILFIFLVLAMWDGFRAPFRDGMPPQDIAPDVAAPGGAAPLGGEGNRWPLWIRLWPVYPLVAFLLLQLLVRVTRRPPTREGTSSPGEETSSPAAWPPTG